MLFFRRSASGNNVKAMKDMSTRQAADFREILEAFSNPDNAEVPEGSPLPSSSPSYSPILSPRRSPMRAIQPIFERSPTNLKELSEIGFEDLLKQSEISPLPPSKKEDEELFQVTPRATPKSKMDEESGQKFIKRLRPLTSNIFQSQSMEDEEDEEDQVTKKQRKKEDEEDEEEEEDQESKEDEEDEEEDDDAASDTSLLREAKVVAAKKKKGIPAKGWMKTLVKSRIKEHNKAKKESKK